MAGRADIDRLKAAVSGQRAAELLGLTGQGRRFFCPACQPDGGKTPDLSAGDAGFKCFKCDAHGDVLALVQLARRTDFNGAFEFLAAATGLDRGDGRKADRRRTGKPPERRTPTRTTLAMDRQPRVVDVFVAFLAGCRPVEGPALSYLTGRGIDADVVARLGLRFCGREYAGLMARLESEFGRDLLQSAGLLTVGRRGLYPTFLPFASKQVGFLVLPYLCAGRPVYLKARPPLDKATTEAKGVPRFLNTGGAVPCLFNVDVVADADRILVCEGETDTLTALSHGFAAVGVPGWSHFKPSWADLFRDKSVFLVLDADRAGDRGVRDIAKTFDRAGLPLPRRVQLPAGMDLNEFMTEGWKSGMREGLTDA